MERMRCWQSTWLPDSSKFSSARTGTTTRTASSSTHGCPSGRSPQPSGKWLPKPWGAVVGGRRLR